jgi:hypothetical protein
VIIRAGVVPKVQFHAIPSPLSERVKSESLSGRRLKLEMSLCILPKRGGCGLWFGATVHGTILVYGNDSMLVATRRLIFSKAGYNVLTAAEFADAMLMLVNQPIDLLVLCQSLTDEERRGILETAHSINPEIKTAVLRYEGLDLPVESGEIVEGLEGPVSLLEAIGRILHQKARSQPTLKG